MLYPKQNRSISHLNRNKAEEGVLVDNYLIQRIQQWEQLGIVLPRISEEMLVQTQLRNKSNPIPRSILPPTKTLLTKEYLIKKTPYSARTHCLLTLMKNLSLQRCDLLTIRLRTGTTATTQEITQLLAGWISTKQIRCKNLLKKKSIFHLTRHHLLMRSLKIKAKI